MQSVQPTVQRFNLTNEEGAEILNKSPLLSVAIPTWNRVDYLANALAQLASELALVDATKVEIIVSDNHSTDNTQELVRQWIGNGLPIRYVKNLTNLGPDLNIAQCFNLSKGKFVQIIGDDDVFVPGGLKVLLDLIEAHQDSGVVSFRCYGYDNDYRIEYPGGGGSLKVFSNANEFIKSVGPLVTLISACAVNKKILPGVDANAFCGSNLGHVDILIRAAITSKYNLFTTKYLVACKRNNSGGYNWSNVFVTNFFGIVDSYKEIGLTLNGIRDLELRMITGFYPFYLLKLVAFDNEVDLKNERKIYDQRFGRRWQYYLFLVPILSWPKPFGIAWGAFITLAGRLAQGDARRGFTFVRDRLRLWCRHVSF